MLRVHLDTDLGGDLDDLCALALLLKWPGTEVDGITTVTDDGGRRAGFVRYATGLAGRRDIPVKAGADVSLGCYRTHCAYQDERYWPISVPRLENSVDEALELLKSSIKKKAILICIGPLTNLYFLDRKYPGILGEARLVLMGGYIYPPAEGYPQWGQNMDFNLQVDVRSAKHVLENSHPLMVPLGVTIRTALRRSYLGKLKQSDDLCRLIAKQAEVFNRDEKYDEKYGKTCTKLPEDIINFLHDPLATAIALGWKGKVKYRDVLLTMDVKDTWLEERVVSTGGRKCRVVAEVDGDEFSKFWLETVTR